MPQSEFPNIQWSHYPTAITGTGDKVGTGNVDTKGYGRAFVSLAYVAIVTWGAAKLQESDDKSTWTDVHSIDVSTLNAAGTEQVIWDVDLRPRKRYLRTLINISANTTLVASSCFVLTKGDSTPTTLAQQHGPGTASIDCAAVFHV